MITLHALPPETRYPTLGWNDGTIFPRTLEMNVNQHVTGTFNLPNTAMHNLRPGDIINLRMNGAWNRAARIHQITREYDPIGGAVNVTVYWETTI